MNLKRYLWLAVPIAAASVAYLSTVRAADHLDSAIVKGDPAADINDVYAWTPATGRLATAMTVFPLATATARFSDKVEYRFAIRGVTNPILAGADGGPAITPTGPYDITCTATAATPQVVSCASAMGGLTASFTVGGTAACDTATTDLCVFAGLRSDPFFFDLAAFQAATGPDAGPRNDAGMPMGDPAGLLDDAGTNFFQGVNGLAIVLNVNAKKLIGITDGGGSNPILAIAGETKRNP